MDSRFSHELIKKIFTSHKEIIIFSSLIIFVLFIFFILNTSEPYTNFKTQRNILGDFCQKMKLIDNNFIKNGDSFIVEKQMFQTLLKDKKQKIEALLLLINKFQKGIYYDVDEINSIKKHNKQINIKTKEQLKIINQAVKNLNSNLNPKIEIKI